MTPVMHVPSSIGNNVTAGTDSVFIPTRPVTAYLTTGSALTGDTFEDADRVQQVAIGSKVPSVKFDVVIRDQTVSGVMEWCIVKVERANATPTIGSGILPTNADITANGLQHSMRKFQPGRVLKFGTRVFNADTPNKVSTSVSLRRFRKETWRTGDYLCFVLHNRSGQAITIDYHARYKAYN
jgi:hypothetical protein